MNNYTLSKMLGPKFKNYGRGGFRFCGGEST